MKKTEKKTEAVAEPQMTQDRAARDQVVQGQTAPTRVVQALENQVADLTQDLQRVRADFENFRKQTEVQKTLVEKATRLQTVLKLLPLIDDMGRAIGTYAELAPLGKTLEKTMNELDLVEIDSKEGQEFNPDVHDAVMVEGEGENEVVAETLRKGYYYNGEVLRPAMVKVKRV